MYAKTTMDKYAKKIVECYKKYTGSDLRIQKTPGSLGTTLSKIDLEYPDNINKYRSFVGQLMWYTTNVGPDVSNVTKEFPVHMSNPDPEHLKSMGRLIVYLKVKESKGIITRKLKVMKEVMF